MDRWQSKFLALGGVIVRSREVSASQRFHFCRNSNWGHGVCLLYRGCPRPLLEVSLYTLIQLNDYLQIYAATRQGVCEQSEHYIYNNIFRAELYRLCGAQLLPCAHA